MSHSQITAADETKNTHKLPLTTTEYLLEIMLMLYFEI